MSCTVVSSLSYQNYTTRQDTDFLSLIQFHFPEKETCTNVFYYFFANVKFFELKSKINSFRTLFCFLARRRLKFLYFSLLLDHFPSFLKQFHEILSRFCQDIVRISLCARSSLGALKGNCVYCGSPYGEIPQPMAGGSRLVGSHNIHRYLSSFITHI